MLPTIQAESAQCTPLWGVRRDDGILITPEHIDAYLDHLRSLGRVDGTLEWYRRGLMHLQKSLPEDKLIGRGTLTAWRDALLSEGYAPGTINTFLVAADGYLEEAGAREYQIAARIRNKDELQPELTRTEYLRLLQTARTLGRERVYLLIKLFATTGFPLQAVPDVTVERVLDGKVTVEATGVKQLIRFPKFLQDELLSYARRKGVLSGPIFLARDGTPMSRTNVSTGIRQLCAAAQVPEEKGNPRCLKRLYQSTRADIEANIALLVEQTLERKLEEEQLSIGWEDNPI